MTPATLPPKKTSPSAKRKQCGGKHTDPRTYTYVVKDDKCYWRRRYGEGCKMAGKCITTQTDDKLRNLIKQGRAIPEV